MTLTNDMLRLLRHGMAILWLLPIVVGGNSCGHAQRYDRRVSDPILSALQKELGHLDSTNLALSESVYHCKLQNIGDVKIYRGQTLNSKSNFLPAMARQKFCFIQSKDGMHQAILFADSITFVKARKEDGSDFIGGYRINKNGLSHFLIWNFAGSQFSVMFESSDFVYNYSLDCESYANNGYLIFSNEDLNGDGLLDLNFSGIRNSYCKGLEWGIGRGNRDPIRQDTVFFSYYQVAQQNYPNWIKQ